MPALRRRASSRRPVKSGRVSLITSAPLALLSNVLVNPIKHNVGNLQIVFVKHHHVAIAMYANVRKVDERNVASRRFDPIGIGGAALIRRDPLRKQLNIISEND